MAPISEEKVAERSYQFWEQEGRPEGRHLEHWFQARAELEAEAALAKSLSRGGRPAAGRKSDNQSEQLLRILRAR